MGQFRRRHFLVALGATALASPLPCLAQHSPRAKRIGVLALDRAEAGWVRTRQRWVLDSLTSAGYIVGKDVLVEWRFAEGNKERLPGLAEDLVHLKVDAIVAWNDVSVNAASQATRDIPIVMYAYTADPVDRGLAASLAHPGGNVTGTRSHVDLDDQVVKQYQILKLALPGARRVASMWYPWYPEAHRQVANHNSRVQREVGLVVTSFVVENGDQISSALARIAEFKPDAIYVAMLPVIRARVDEVVAFTREHKLVSMGSGTPWTEEGGLMTYAIDIRHMMERTMSFVIRILRGAKAGDLPIEEPSRFELLFNQQTARAIGYQPTQELSVLIDRVIE